MNNDFRPELIRFIREYRTAIDHNPDAFNDYENKVLQTYPRDTWASFVRDVAVIVAGVGTLNVLGYALARGFARVGNEIGVDLTLITEKNVRASFADVHTEQFGNFEPIHDTAFVRLLDLSPLFDGSQLDRLMG